MMVRHVMMAAMVAALLAAPADAQTTAVTDGEITQCVVAMSTLGRSATGTDQANINGVMLFFLGKLAARHSPAELTALIARASTRSGSANMAATARDCAKEVEQLGATMQAGGRADAAPAK